ncbi:MAG: helix-turn-helix domain-containing protein [Lachnospiraceae bacterium]|nr:helix-turn-helix domain-containing protein [Lachnospiraceae bacterium]
MSKDNCDKITTLDDMPFILSITDIAKILNISTAKAYKVVKSDGFPVMRIGNKFAIPKLAFEQWLNKSVENLEKQE